MEEIKIPVNINGIEKAIEKSNQLVNTLKEANTLADELASKIEISIQKKSTSQKREELTRAIIDSKIEILDLVKKELEKTIKHKSGASDLAQLLQIIYS